jgi:hypothetical protein
VLATTAAPMPAEEISTVLRVALEKDLRDLSVPTKDMTDEELRRITTKAKTSVDACEEITVLAGNLNTAARYVLGAALEIQKERHDAAQKLLPKEQQIPWHKARDRRISKHYDDECRALVRNAPSFDEAKEVPWPIAKKKWVRTGISSRDGRKAAEGQVKADCVRNPEAVLAAQGGNEEPAKTEAEQAHRKTERQVAPSSGKEYAEELQRQLPGYQHRLQPSLRPHWADSTASSFRVGRIGDRYHLVVLVAGEPRWVFHSIDVNAIYDLLNSIYDARDE